MKLYNVTVTVLLPTHLRPTSRDICPKEVNPKLEPTKQRSSRSEEIFSLKKPKKHCLLCGKECISVRDSKNSNQWRL